MNYIDPEKPFENGKSLDEQLDTLADNLKDDDPTKEESNPTN